jgi:catechol 2,3-dioxygenase-like lactoylglutathione lyase family enzyme
MLVYAAAAVGQPLPLEGIAHVGFGVRDPAKSDAYYTGIVGLERAFKTSDGAVFYKVSDDQFVKIVRTVETAAPPFHLALQTTDIAATRRMLRSREIAAPAAVKDSAGNLTFSLIAPEGTRVEFVEYIAGSLQAAARGRFLHAARISNHL